MTVDEALWKAIVNCEPTFDGQYFYGVVTTGIYCRPSCRSRTPLRENTRIIRSVDEARSLGFRPCKRCRPDGCALSPDAELVQSTKGIIEHRYHDFLTLEILAQTLAVSPYHLHRIFKRLTGTTPAEYLLDKRLQVAREALHNDPCRKVTDIAMGVGFRSVSYFSTVFRRKTGCSPSDYRLLHQRNPTTEEAVR